MSHPRSPRQSVTIEPGRLWKGEEMMPMLLRQQHTEAQAGLGEQGLRWCGAWGNQQSYIYIYTYILNFNQLRQGNKTHQGFPARFVPALLSGNEETEMS